MSGVLVTYATRTGSVTGIAERIGEVIRRQGVDADVRRVDDWPDPTGYDAVIVGSSVRGAHWLKIADQWVEQHAESLGSRPVAFFTVSLSTVNHPENIEHALRYTDKLIEHTGVRPVTLEVFDGWFLPETLTIVERGIVRGFGVPEGDYRDWPLIEKWAADLPELLGVRVPAMAR